MTTPCTIRTFLDARTGTLTHVLWDRARRHAAVVDPVLGYDARSERVDTAAIDEVLGYLASERLRLQWILETHPHADHLSGAHALRGRAGGRIATGSGIRQVQATCKRLFDLEPEFKTDGSQFDRLFEDGEPFAIGGLHAEALHVPGHTPADMAYLVAGVVFVGDALFMPDVGSGRTDFPGASARQLFRSIRRLLALPPDIEIYVGHDYPPPNRAAAWRATVAEQRASNIHVHAQVSEEDFVALRTARDAALAMPALMIPALQINVRAGAFPPEGTKGLRPLRSTVGLQDTR
jgi:glyoxylase-like metal-dependent hydrolase (beta-lactamase superfamily II)